MFLNCKKKLSPLQRRSLQMFGGNLLLIAGISVVSQHFLGHGHPSKAVALCLAVMAAIPVVGIMAVAGRYLSQETDEFVRLLVTRALLWGLGVTMVANTMTGLLGQFYPTYRLPPILDIDLFCITAMIALRVQLWRSQS
jgi:hypothetical protein